MCGCKYFWIMCTGSICLKMQFAVKRITLTLFKITDFLEEISLRHMCLVGMMLSVLHWFKRRKETTIYVTSGAQWGWLWGRKKCVASPWIWALFCWFVIQINPCLNCRCLSMAGTAKVLTLVKVTFSLWSQLRCFCIVILYILLH